MVAKPLSRLEQKKLTHGMERLGKAGIDVDRWLAMLDASDAEMRTLVDAWPIFSKSYAYDAVSIFGFGQGGEEPMPEPKVGQFVIRYGGWSLLELCDSAIGKNLMQLDEWCRSNCYPFNRLRHKPGIYRLRIPVSRSNKLISVHQQIQLSMGQMFAPVVLAATAMLCHRQQSGEEVLRGNWIRCAEEIKGNDHVGLGWKEGRLTAVSFGNMQSGPHLWASSVQTS